MVSTQRLDGSLPPVNFPKSYGITKPLSLAGPSAQDIKRNAELEKFLVDEGLYESKEERRSITGYVFTAGENTVSWRSSLQHIVALSTTEAEYIALVEAIKEAMWLRGLTEELGFKQDATSVFSDSQSAICLAKNNVHHDRTKHISVKLHFIRDIVKRGEVKVLKIHTSINPADMLTKVIPVHKFEQALAKLKIENCA